MQGNLLIAQSGGPTSAINATLVGILQLAKSSERIGHVLGSHYGIEGLLNHDLLLLDKLLDDPVAMRDLYYTPASALGSCRFKLNDPEQAPATYEKIVQTLRKNHITYFIYIGGNDSMDTVQKLSLYLQKNHITDIHIMGAPKTIDNDLVQTDHCPGFGSAAKFVATTFSELERDFSSYADPGVVIVEVKVIARPTISAMMCFTPMCYPGCNTEQDEGKLLRRLLKTGDRERAVCEDVRGQGSGENHGTQFLHAVREVPKQTELAEKTRNLQEQLTKSEQESCDAEKWIALIKQYANPAELNAPLLNALIEKIVVHEPTTGEDGNREQEVEIFYRFTGKID